MPRLSAGLLPFRLVSGRGLEVFVVHPGGPYWANKDEGAWSIAKGEYEPGEDPHQVAQREFLEETGARPPRGRTFDLGEVRQPGGKRIRVWAVDAPSFTITAVVSNEFELEWPPRSGRIDRFPEVDRATWMSVELGRSKLLKGQVEFLDRLEAALASP